MASGGLHSALGDYDELELEMLRRGYVRVEARITRMTPNNRGRYIIYLPKDNNELWELIRGSGARVVIYMKVPWAVLMVKAHTDKEGGNYGGPATS